jgi:hypothetical protein
MVGESSSHAADGRLPTPPTSVYCNGTRLLYITQQPCLFLVLACGSAARRAAVRSLTFASKQHTPAPEPPTSLRFSTARIEGLFAT